LSRATVLRLTFGVVLIAGLTAALCLVPRLAGLEGQLRHLRNQLGDWGLVLLGLAFTPLCLVLCPASVIIMLAGFFYDVLPALAAVSLGSTLAAGVIFAVGRTVARGWLEARLRHSARFQALDQAVADHGFRIVVLSRLSPLFPFIFLNYAFSLTRVRFRSYLLATWLGMLPNIALWIYLGSTIQDFTQLLQGRARGQETTAFQIWHTALTVLGLLAALAVTLIVGRLARRALRQSLPGLEDPAKAVPALAKSA
jgi:uncharacterized membrane protein YdjX (TVP38/TMEM64 family)